MPTPNWREESVAIAGIEVHFYRGGAGPPLVLLHGHQPTPQEADQAEEALETLVRLCWKPYMHEPRLPFLLPRLHQPALIVWGREDALVPLECGELYQQHIAGSRLAVLDACGHCPQIEKPAARRRTRCLFHKYTTRLGRQVGQARGLPLLAQDVRKERRYLDLVATFACPASAPHAVLGAGRELGGAGARGS